MSQRATIETLQRENEFLQKQLDQSRWHVATLTTLNEQYTNRLIEEAVRGMANGTARLAVEAKLSAVRKRVADNRTDPRLASDYQKGWNDALSLIGRALGPESTEAETSASG